MKTIQLSVRRLALLCLLTLAATAAAARAQTVIPRVCVDAPYQTGTTTLAAAAAAGARTIQVNGYVPPLVSLVINPGGANQETVPYIRANITGNGPYTLTTDSSFASYAIGGNFVGTYPLSYSHAAGETITFAGYSGLAYWGYNNTTNAPIPIPIGILTGNFFAPGPITYSQQTASFQPGIHDAAFITAFGGQAGDVLTWFLDSGTAAARNGVAARCMTITYQGRLSDSGASANGQYDLQFTTYDALTGGTAQSGTITVENAPVVNGVFTVQLNFGSSFTNNDKARFLEIGVRAGTSTGAFTILTPRQLITSVPFAVNAAIASGVRLPITSVMPSAGDCDEISEYGQMQVSTTTLYICTPAGWKTTALQ